MANQPPLVKGCLQTLIRHLISDFNVKSIILITCDGGVGAIHESPLQPPQQCHANYDLAPILLNVLT